MNSSATATGWKATSSHVEGGLANDVTATDILDLLRCVAFETGNPKALAAFERLAKVERRGGSDPSDKKDENLQV